MKRNAFVLFVLLALLGCRSTPEPDYARPLPPGHPALVRVRGGERMPDPGEAWRRRGPELLAAIEESLRWFDTPSSRRFFPFEGIATHEQAAASLVAFRHLLTTAKSAEEFRAELWRMFTFYRSVGWDGSGTVLFTGYYAPEFPASRTRTERFRCPLFRRPADLVTDPVTGEPKGRRLPDGSVGPCPTRREIEEGGLFDGSELVWLEDPLSAYIVHVNGSAKLLLPDETVLYVGYDGKTDREYAGLGESLVAEGLVEPERLGLPALREAFRRQPEKVKELMYRNESYVFFTEYDGANWPAGSLGVKVTAKASLATDKRIYPRGGVVMVATNIPAGAGRSEEFLSFLLDQDTGGAIRAPGRADIFMGVGPAAERLAGRQYAEGRLYYFFLKRQYVPRFRPGGDG